MLNASLYVSIYSSSHWNNPHTELWFCLLALPGPMVSSEPPWIGSNYVHSISFYCILVPAKSPYFNEYRVIDYSTIWIRWERLSPKYARGILRGYRIYYTLAYKYYYDGSASNVTVGPDILETTITGLQPNTEYIVWVNAFTSKGEGNDKNTVYIRTSESFLWSSLQYNENNQCIRIYMFYTNLCL